MRAHEIRTPGRRPKPWTQRRPSARQRSAARKGNSPGAWQPSCRAVVTLFSWVASGFFHGGCAMPRGTLDQVQDAREQRVRLGDPADVDDARVAQFIGEYVDDQLENVVIERPERAVDEHPGRRLQQDACDGETQLLVLAQFPI